MVADAPVALVEASSHGRYAFVYGWADELPSATVRCAQKMLDVAGVDVHL
jgi:hypothetical protein